MNMKMQALIGLHYMLKTKVVYFDSFGVDHVPKIY